MKELSIEQKAQRYDEAIKKFGVILNLNTVKESGTIFVDDVEKIFPELKESEDERIVKNIISWLKNIEGQTIPINEYNSALAWLEKQGEKGTKRNNGEIPNSAWSEEDENHVKSILSTIECCKAQFPNAQAVVEAYNADIEWLKSLRLQSQWKPSDEQMDALESAVSSLQSTALESLYQNLTKINNTYDT